MKASFFCVLFILAFSCAKHTPQFQETLAISHHWDSGIRGNNMLGLSGVYNDTIYIWGEESDKYFMSFFKTDGTLLKQLTFKKGKGPGQIAFAFYGKIFDDTLYILDHGMKRISYYDLNGKYIDELALHETSSLDISSFVVIGNTFYCHGSTNTLLCSIDKKTGKIIKIIDYATKIGFEKNEIPILGGYFTYNSVNEELLLGYSNKPFRIDRYDLELNKLGTITMKTDDTLEPCRWMKLSFGGVAVVGHFMVPSINCDTNFLYIPSPYGLKWGDNGHEQIPGKNYFTVLDRKSYQIAGHLTNPELEQMNDGLKIIGVMENTIILLVDDSALINKYLGQQIKQKGAYIFIVKRDNK